jgi:hypothetical protein
MHTPGASPLPLIAHRTDAVSDFVSPNFGE